MRCLIPRFTIRRYLLALAVACPLAASLLGYLTGRLCPLCFSGRVETTYRCVLLPRAEDGRTEPYFGTPIARSCRRCGLTW
ncbi:hypothetical protein OJF2_77990 [Aquisphaera giovannonii]|uniref:Uncharacterized protein n=1 Tax=Aquisphaera giovannonii TaxID=406548 RepID=A0A5B9WF68_9BACT|nr:hypothetical protein [Aquisphaera giovannonii]QEH39187.1 hypothetical protein OJF2_77990 [Aquisphaera giovannonii]